MCLSLLVHDVAMRLYILHLLVIFVLSGMNTLWIAEEASSDSGTDTGRTHRDKRRRHE